MTALCGAAWPSKGPVRASVLALDAAVLWIWRRAMEAVADSEKTMHQKDEPCTDSAVCDLICCSFLA